MTLEDGLTNAILDLTTSERRNLLWQPCDESFRGTEPEAEEYARELATTIIQEAGEDLDPWWMVAQLMQESGFNPCAFSDQEANQLRARLGRRLTRAERIRLLRRSEATHLDAGIAQFRWPGAVARASGITRPEDLLNPSLAIHAYAVSLRRYRALCEQTPVFRGTETRERNGQIRIVYWRYQCTEVFWAVHNTGSTAIRPAYVRRVTARYHQGPERWRREVEELVGG